MTTHPSKIEQQVMAGVGAVYLGRKATSRTAIEIYALVISLWVIGRLVWVSKIFDNFFTVEKHGLGAINTYILYAIEHTHPVVQLTLLVAVVTFVALVIDAGRSIASPTRALAM